MIRALSEIRFIVTISRLRMSTMRTHRAEKKMISPHGCIIVEARSLISDLSRETGEKHLRNAFQR